MSLNKKKYNKPSRQLTIKRKWRTMTRASKQLILGAFVFSLLLIYFLFIFIPTSDKIEGYKEQIETNKLGIASSQEFVNRINDMKESLKDANFTRAPITTYSNLDNETVMITEIITNVKGKNMNIDTTIPVVDISNKNQCVARTIMISFDVDKYDDAVSAIHQFGDLRVKSLVKEFSISKISEIENQYQDNIDTEEENKISKNTNGNINVSVELVFFEFKYS